MRAVLFVGCLALWAGAAQANNAACWGNGTDDPSRPDISCTKITERLLVGMEGATRAEVMKAMDAAGRWNADERSLHYMSNYAQGSRGGTGDVNFVFGDDGRVNAVNGLLDGPDGSNPEYIWNANGGGCSDLPGSATRCNP